MVTIKYILFYCQLVNLTYFCLLSFFLHVYTKHRQSKAVYVDDDDDDDDFEDDDDDAALMALMDGIDSGKQQNQIHDLT